jgi:hypothetical protein
MPVEVVFRWLKDEIEGGCRRQELRSPRRAPTPPVMVSLPFEMMMVSSPLLPVKVDAQPPDIDAIFGATGRTDVFSVRLALSCTTRGRSGEVEVLLPYVEPLSLLS